MVSLAHSVPSTRKPSLDDCGQPKVKEGWWPSLSRHTCVMPKASLTMSLKPKEQPRRIESITWAGQDRGREYF